MHDYSRVMHFSITAALVLVLLVMTGLAIAALESVVVVLPDAVRAIQTIQEPPK